MSVVIKVENVSKLYRLGEVGTGSLAHDVNRWWHRVRGKEDPYLKIGQVNDRERKAEKLKTEKLKQDKDEAASQPPITASQDPAVSSSSPISAFQPFSVSAFSSDYIYALKDINFEVKQGEVLGIIGRNGAGKSTLLKILSRVTTPTTGQIKVKGRIASLLEVGTGFHPELTGRENIFLNGAILGMRKDEIARKFDEIVDFSGCERYIDTPVKRYSSGMYVRLAFAVAAHLEPEILIVDEVLSVGDAEFQKKCVGKMKDVAGQGRTVLFVSHNMGVVSDLCGRCLMLANGTLTMNDETATVVGQYLSADTTEAVIDLRGWKNERSGDGPMRVTRLSTSGPDQVAKGQFKYKEPICFNISLNSDRTRQCILGVAIRNGNGQCVLHLNNTDDGAPLVVPHGDSEVRVTLEENILRDERYYVTVWLGDGMNVLNDRVGNCLSFLVCSSMHGSVRSLGSVRLPAHWKILSS